MPSIQSVANILKETGERASLGIPDDFVKWCEALKKSADTFAEIIEALTDTDEYNRETRRIKEERDSESEDMYWNDIQRKLPELNDYSSLSQALLDGFDELSIQQLQGIKREWPTYTRTNCEFRENYDRGIRVATHYRPGYVIWVYETIDQRNLTARKFEGVISSLNVVRSILKSWMLDRVSIEDVAHKHTWLQEVKS